MKRCGRVACAVTCLQLARAEPPARAGYTLEFSGLSACSKGVHLAELSETLSTPQKQKLHLPSVTSLCPEAKRFSTGKSHDNTVFVMPLARPAATPQRSDAWSEAAGGWSTAELEEAVSTCATACDADIRCNGFYLFNPRGTTATLQTARGSPAARGSSNGAAAGSRSSVPKCRGLADIGSQDGTPTDLNDYSYKKQQRQQPNSAAREAEAATEGGAPAGVVGAQTETATAAATAAAAAAAAAASASASAPGGAASISAVYEEADEDDVGWNQQRLHDDNVQPVLQQPPSLSPSHRIPFPSPSVPSAASALPIDRLNRDRRVDGDTTTATSTPGTSTASTSFTSTPTTTPNATTATTSGTTTATISVTTT